MDDLLVKTLIYKLEHTLLCVAEALGDVPGANALSGLDGAASEAVDGACGGFDGQLALSSRRSLRCSIWARAAWVWASHTLQVSLVSDRPLHLRLAVKRLHLKVPNAHTKMLEQDSDECLNRTTTSSNLQSEHLCNGCIVNAEALKLCSMRIYLSQQPVTTTNQACHLIRGPKMRNPVPNSC